MDINLVAPINTLGYGVVGCNIFKSLLSGGNTVSLFPIGNVDWPSDNSLQKNINDSIRRAEFYNNKSPSVRIWHQYQLDMFPGNGPRIGWPIFELNKFNDREKHNLSSVDKLIVCSDWAKQVVEDNGINVPVSVAPLGVDPSIFFVDVAERATRAYWQKDTTVFINMGKWEKRKGHNELIAAFCDAFNPGDNVELWMINDNPFIGHENFEWKKKYADTKMVGHIKFFPRLETHEQIRKIYNHADCGVFPSHAEGWNLEIPELMACGAHIIATNYSGHTQFLTESNSLLLDVTGMEPAVDGKWFNGQGDWATFDNNQLVEHMKNIHRKKQSGELGLNIEGIQTVKNLTWSNTVDNIIECLKEEVSHV
jgi:glycosyltransferase involved in cell wall biosynthesis